MEDDLLECCDDLCEGSSIVWWKILLFLWVLS
jgi:hypothetical protein